MRKDNPHCPHDQFDDEASRLARLHDLISTHGFTKMGVLGPKPFVYTIGLTLRGLHELIADGDPKIVHQVVDDLAHGSMNQPESFGPDKHVTIDGPGGQRFLIHLGAPTSANFKRAAYARQLYSGLHRVRVLHVVPAHPLGWAGYTGTAPTS